MYFERDGGELTAVLVNPRSTKKCFSDLSPLCILEVSDLERLLSCTSRWLTGKKFRTQLNRMHNVLRPFGKYLHWDNEICGKQKKEYTLPVNFVDWQRLTLQFGLWYISQPQSEASLGSRCRAWRKAVCPWLYMLQDEGVIPEGVTWSDMQLPQECVVLGSPQIPQLMGDVPATIVANDDAIEKAPFNNTLAGPIFWHTDDEYLNQIEVRLRHRDKTLATALDDYWSRLVLDYRNGKKCLKRVTSSDWQEREKRGNWHLPYINGLIHLASPANSDAHFWALRLIQHQLEHSDDPGCLSQKILARHPVVANDFLKRPESTPVLPLLGMSALLPLHKKHFKPRQIFNRFIGILNRVDIVVAMALLIREHPNLNPLAIAGAKLLNSHGKSFILVTDNAQNTIFSVDKPRAKKRKYLNLTHRAARIMRHLLRSTALVRALLRRSGSPHWRYLFLGEMPNGVLGHPPRVVVSILHSANYPGVTLPKLYPCLAEAGLSSGTLDFAKLRNSQGVLQWFDTGSVKEVSRRLGNSDRVAIEYYIPGPILAAWNERIVRRFQNTLLVLAAHEERWLLDVVDMSNLDELNCFLAQLVYLLPAGRSPIADKVQELFGARYRIDQYSDVTSEKKADGILHVRLSATSLALLLAYKQWALENLTQTIQSQPDRETGLTPRHFIDLAGVLQATAQNDHIGDHLRESLDVARLKRVYSQAAELVPNWLAHLKGISVCITDEIGEIL